MVDGVVLVEHKDGVWLDKHMNNYENEIVSFKNWTRMPTVAILFRVQ